MWQNICMQNCPKQPYLTLFLHCSEFITNDGTTYLALSTGDNGEGLHTPMLWPNLDNVFEHHIKLIRPVYLSAF